MWRLASNLRAGLFGVLAVVCCALPLAAQAEQMRICATTQDLGSIARTLGGEEARVTVFARPQEDPHFVEIRPSHLVALRDADLLLVQGFDLEVGWLPALLQRARNARILPGAAGYLDASRGIRPLGEIRRAVDRSEGDVHPFGNPHYLNDPVRVAIVARLVRDRLVELRPQWRERVEERHRQLHARLGASFFGELAQQYDWEKLALLFAAGRLAEFLQQQEQTELLGGWAQKMQPLHGAEIISEHDSWIYFAERFGLEIVAVLEPKPGMPPTSAHLQQVVELAKRREVPLIATVSYFDPRHAQFVAEHSGATLVAVAHQVGARPGCDDIVATIDHNVQAFVQAMR